MTRSLRRSRRAPKKHSDYNVGDVVEIHRNGIALEGRLAQLLTVGESANPRWLIKFDRQPYKDEEMYERVFGKILAPNDDEGSTDTGSTGSNSKSTVPTGTQGTQWTQGNETTAKPVGTNAADGTTSKNSGNSSEGETGDDAKIAKQNAGKGKTGQLEICNAGSDVDSETSGRTSRSARDRVSARETRSKRRQAKIDDDIIPGLTDGVLTGTKREISPPITTSRNKRHRGEEDGEVVKVNLLTGTLYLYRGKQRRAEFVRRV